MAPAGDDRPPQRQRQRRRCAPSSSLLLHAAAAAMLLLLLSSFSAPASAATHGAVFTRDARPVVTIVPAFSFGNDGYIDLEITKWEYWHKKGADGIDLQRVAFVAADASAAAAVAAAAARGECPLDAPRAVRLLDFEQVDYNRREGFNATFFNGRLLELVPKYKGGGTFSLLYVNCEAAYAVASFQARASLYSVLPAGGGRDFLPAGLGPLKSIYGCAAASAAAIFVLWAWSCVSGRRYLSFSFGASPAAALGAGLLAALTGLSFFAARGAAAAVRERGQAPAWAAASAALELARVGSLFGMLLLAGRGVGWGAANGSTGTTGGGLSALFASVSRRTCAGSPSCGIPSIPALLSNPRDSRLVSVVLPFQIAVELALALVRGAASPAAPAADGSGGIGLSLSALLSGSALSSASSSALPSSSSLAAFGAPGTRARNALYLAAAAGAVLVLLQVGWSERRAAASSRSRLASLSPAGRNNASATTISNDAKAGRAAASGALWRRWYTCALLGVYGGRAAAALAAAAAPQPRGAWAPAAAGAAASLVLALAAVLECCPSPTCEYGLLTLGLGNAASTSAASAGRQAGGNGGREAEMSLRTGGRMS